MPIFEEEPILTKKDFKENTEHLIARKAVREKWIFSFADLRRAFKNSLQRVRESRIADVIAEQDSPFYENVYQLVEDIQKQIAEKYQIPGFGFILLGSAATGGALIREATRNLQGLDLDYAVLSDEVISDEILKKIIVEIRDLAKNMARKYRLPKDFHADTFFDADRFHLLNLHSADEVSHMFQIFLETGVFDPDFHLYFAPSLPAERNQQNRNYILEALKGLYLRNPQGWGEVKEQLIFNTMNSRTIKEEHFGNKLSKSEKRRGKLIENGSGEVLQQPIITFIDSSRSF